MKNVLDSLSTFVVSWQCEGASPLHLNNPRHSITPDIDPAFPSKYLVEEVRETVELRLRYQLRMAEKATLRSFTLHQLVFEAPRGSGSCTCQMVVLTSLQAEDLFISLNS